MIMWIVSMYGLRRNTDVFGDLCYRLICSLGDHTKE